jgi:cholesterol transport system auxiliary component
MMRNYAHNVPRLGFAAIAALLLSSCVSFGAKAPPTMLVLSPAKMVSSGTAKTGAPKDALVVLLADVPQKLNTNRVPVQVDAGNVAYIKNAMWSDKPARLMQALLSETVAGKNGTFVLNEADTGGKAEHFLSGSLIEFGIDASRMEAVVAYDAVRMRKGQPISKKRFEAREPVSRIEAIPSGSALNIAANRVANDVADWLAEN